jgi:serine/threonine-protein kinase
MAAQAQRGDRDGEVIGGRYQLLGLLGRGGQGSVYKARDLRDNDEVAIKVLADSFAEDSDWRERMFREARAMSTLSGTAAVRVFDQQWTGDGSLCLVMELLHGHDLDEWLHALESHGKRLPVAALPEIFKPIVDTLEVAHLNGIVHRDLKPGNIFIIDASAGGGVRLLDFGFAKFTRMRSFTAAGVVAGSPSYMAPETWMGKAPDHRVDVYALGALVFRALAGQPPFYSPELHQMLILATSSERPSLAEFRPDLPRGIDDWVQQALAVNPDERFLNCRALYNSLRGLLGFK